MDESCVTPRETVDKLIATWSSMSDVLAWLTEEQWKSATDLPGWNVQDTLSHVIGTERFLEGLPDSDPLPDEQPRLRPGAEVLAEWEELRVAREHTLLSADHAYFAEPMETPTGPGTMVDFLALRILDCWVHEQDIRWALGLPPGFDSAGAAHTVDRLTTSLPMVVGKRGACPEDSAVAIELTGPGARRLVCEVTGGRAAFVESSSEPPMATITMDSECYVLLATGRRTPANLACRIDIHGDEDLAGRVLAGMNVLF